MLTIRKYALTGGGTGVVHSAACGYLHAAQAQLVVALVDAGVLHVELRDAARGTQVFLARCRCLVSIRNSRAATYQELHAAHIKPVGCAWQCGRLCQSAWQRDSAQISSSCLPAERLSSLYMGPNEALCS